MRKLLALTFFILSVLMLSSCDYIEQITIESPDPVQIKLMDTRPIIRDASIALETRVYKGGLLNQLAFEAQGSGVIFRADDEYYYILTNHHVVDKGEYAYAEYTIATLNENDIIATIVVSDEVFDLAVLRFDRGERDLTIINIEMRQNTPLERGEMVLAVGSPGDMSAIVTYGEYRSMVPIDAVEFEVIYHTAMIYHGFSGGALTDLDGNLVGINTWGNGQDNVEGLAVSLAEVHLFLIKNNLWP